MNKLPAQTREFIVRCLVEGTGMRQTARIVDCDVESVMVLLAKLGAACEEFHHVTVRNVKCEAIECDEMWSYVQVKDENVSPSRRLAENIGSYYTWLAIDPETKLIPCWHVGRREASDANIFINDLASRVVGRIQLSTDGFTAYQPAIEDAFGDEVDYGKLLKIFEDALSNISAKDFLRKRDQPPLHATKKVSVLGNPDSELIGTSIIERFNLTVRMSLRRYARQTIGFSKKLEMHKAATALHNVHYNFARIHKSIRCTPAMEAGLSDHVWETSEILDLIGKY